ncbi:putative beta-glucosidase I [Cadophora sp. MPI-SDFR-AT-0126]|nr:putative beta-glucosidase I [Leotiomycetes sp. MPI-SDFR-AT-0126]
MANINVEEMLLKLSLDEKVSLTAGVDMWHTTPIPRLGIPSLRVSDGPNGVRGTKFFDSTPAACLPCGTGLGATWDVTLLRALGNLLGLEAKAKGAHILLGPTVNIQRTPLGGRGFESFAEDPVLSGLLAASYCNGVQDEDIMTSIKHFVCNDQEDKRMSVNITVSDRALREIYLLPFMLAIRDSNPGSIMTAYNKLNGTYCSENYRLLDDMLRKEWGWKGMIVSDWYGTYSTTEAISAGLDLEMPGPTRWRTIALSHAVRSGKLEEKFVDDRVRNILCAIKKAHRSGIPAGFKETTRKSKADRLLLRKAAADSIVLLKNDEKILPLKKNRTTAVIGSNARVATFCGGGSASLNPYYTSPVLEAIRFKCGDVRYAEGPFSHLEFSLLDGIITDTNGDAGFTFRSYLDPPEVDARECIDTMYVKTTKFFLADYSPSRLKSSLFWAEMEACLTPNKSGQWEFGLSTYGTARLFIDGVEVIDNATRQEPGNSFLGAGTKEVMGAITLCAGQKYKLLITFGSAPTSRLIRQGDVTIRKGGVRFRGGPQTVVDEAIEEAMEVARNAEQVVIVAGLNGDWEVEGQDRANMDLPPHTDTLISKVLQIRPDTVVVIQSGTPVTMPWADQAKSIVQMWYGGNETGNGLADILFGDVNPSGKLPLTFPRRVQDCPAFLHSKSDKGRMIYGEDIYVGYRYYEKLDLPVLFPFGHGLSYTSFQQRNLQLQVKDGHLIIILKLENTGEVAGAEVVQAYISQLAPSVSRPIKELKGFLKVFLLPKQVEEVKIDISINYATSFWDESLNSWTSEAGVYEVIVANSSASLFPLRGTFEIPMTASWDGL